MKANYFIKEKDPAIKEYYIYKLIEFIEKESIKTKRSKSEISKEIIEFYKFRDVNSLIRARYIMKNELLRGVSTIYIKECRRFFLFLNFILNKIKKDWY